MKRLIAILLVLCMAVGLVACGKKDAPAAEQVDPNAIAKIVNGTETKYVKTPEEMVAAVAENGNTQITLLKDVSMNTSLNLPYSATLDLGGFTLMTNQKQGIGIMVDKAGTENGITTVKNGTVRSYADCLRVKGGGMVVENADLYCTYGTCTVLYDTNEAYKELNRITGSSLVSNAQGCFSFYTNDGDYSKTGITIQDSALYALNAEGAKVFHKGGAAVTGCVELGKGVKIYSYAKILAPKEMWFNGSGMAKEKVTATVDGTDYAEITCWQEDTENQVIDVLMIGNSFCWYFVEELHGVADAAGVQLNVNNLYEAGCLVQEHWDWLQSDAEEYEQFWITNDFGRFKNPENLKASAALAYDEWDVITFQQHYGSGVTKVEAAREKLVNADGYFDYLKTNFPNAKLYWHNTWAYQVGFSDAIATTADQKVRQDNINMLSQEVADRNSVDQIPGGQAWAIARKTVGDDLCKSDLYHDGDVGGGQYLNACIWFEVLTGKSCIGNTWRPDTYRLDEAKIAGLQQAAHQAVAEMYGADYAK